MTYPQKSPSTWNIKYVTKAPIAMPKIIPHPTTNLTESQGVYPNAIF